MARIINLDELLPPDIEVELRGKVYRLPPDIPAELFLRFTDPENVKLADEDNGRPLIEKLYEGALELFRYGDPAIESLPIGMNELVRMIPAIYNPQAEDDGDDAERPTTPKTRGASSKTRTRR